jgi:DNA-binding NarL/FixJ family response regulator
MNGLQDRSAVIFGSHTLWVEGLECLLGRLGISGVAKARTSAEAVALVSERRPDLFVADLDGIDLMDGSDLLERVRAQHAPVRIVVIANTADARAIEFAFAAGAAAYCTKAAEPDDLSVAIRQSFEHSIYLAAARGDDAPRPAAEQPAEPPQHDLTRRELEILRLVAEGRSNAQVAGLLWVTEQTVKFHLANIYRKLAVANRTEASRWAQINGLLPLQRVPSAA